MNSGGPSASSSAGALHEDASSASATPDAKAARLGEKRRVRRDSGVAMRTILYRKATGLARASASRGRSARCLHAEIAASPRCDRGQRGQPAAGRARANRAASCTVVPHHSRSRSLESAICCRLMRSHGHDASASRVASPFVRLTRLAASWETRRRPRVNVQRLLCTIQCVAASLTSGRVRRDGHGGQHGRAARRNTSVARVANEGLA